MTRCNLNLSFDLSKPVRLYYNLHKHCLSILAKSSKGLRLYCHTDNSTVLKLERVSFKVYEVGRERVLRERRKNVHAYVIGYISEGVVDCPEYGLISYNPYKAGHFFLNGERVDHVGEVNIINDEIRVAKDLT